VAPWSQGSGRGSLTAREIFVSYQWADKIWARLLHARLRSKGGETWYDAQVGMGQN
jgi:hypothetical protein